MKKAWQILFYVLVWLVVLTAVAAMVFTLFSVRLFNSNERSLFGHHFYIVLSDSMSASGIHAGDLVVVRQVDPTTLEPGDIISFQSQNADNYGMVVTHMIRAKTTDRYGSPAFVTYGTTTGTDDETLVTYPYVMGKLATSLPKVGTFFNFMKTPVGYIVCILLPFMLLIGYQGLNTVRAFRLYRNEQMEEMQQQKQQLEQDRKRSEEMMQQLLQMQQQFAAQQTAVQQPPAAPAPTPTPAPAQNQPDVAAMMAELEALRARLAAQDAAQPNGAAQQKENNSQ